MRAEARERLRAGQHRRQAVAAVGVADPAGALEHLELVQARRLEGQGPGPGAAIGAGREGEEGPGLDLVRVGLEVGQGAMQAVDQEPEVTHRAAGWMRTAACETHEGGM